jgi:prepilin-type N-terminal cleavage/methylation domain-containing protein
MRARSGVTLLEVLIAIFIMGIGLLALLALFPLGASVMALAMRDARCAEAGHNAKGTCFGQNGPSYPVFVDPIGVYYIGLGNAPLAVNLPRTSWTLPPDPNPLITNGNKALRWCSLADDYTFDNSGSANNSATGVERESRYTWAYLMKLPNVQSPSVVDISVVVYQGRNLQVAGGETPYTVLTNGPKTIAVAYSGGNKPNIKRGGWILDVTSYNPNDPDPTKRALALKYGPVAANFYRVVDITDVNIAGQPALEVELQTSLVGVGNTIPQVTNILVLDNVAEVFSIGTGWKQ